MISDILDANPEVAALVRADLTTDKHRKRKKNTGAHGMTAEQVLRFAIVQKRERLSCRRLYGRVDDSIVLRKFCRVPFSKVPACQHTATELAAEVHTTDTRRIGNKDCG